ncbi:2-hydroxychromene-2-carboxylate isomerase [Dongia deserti]|uniref:2-hydroxychromene-2-carboxylate isomerase n=1 Tax=Dongia deserti TaxID=2268030 RepID=UPI000E647C08|nr:2-hydroxychromene-2-carboxylate isomerase [Dongia deserti]
MNGAPIEFYFDFSSPYGYLGAQRIDTIVAEFGRTVTWRPILLGAIFKITGQAPLVSQVMRGPYAARDMARSARKLGVTFALPEAFPFSSVYPCRVFYWLNSHSPDAAKKYARAVYHAAFAEGKPPAEPQAAADVAVGLGHDHAAVLAGMQDAAIKERLRTEVQQAMDKGVFGSPFVIVDGEPFWGNDRLGEVREWLQTGGW